MDSGIEASRTPLNQKTTRSCYPSEGLKMYQKPEDWHSLFEAMALDLPLGLQRLMLGAGEAELEVEEAASKAHHAWVNLAGTMVNAVYVRTGFWDFALDALNSTMRMQRLGQA